MLITDLGFLLKLLFFTLLQYIPLYIWSLSLKRKQIDLNWNLIISYFIFGSWFGIFGEFFIFKIINLFFDMPIWEYRILPIPSKIVSYYGPIMWGNAAVYICFHKQYHFLNIESEHSFLKNFVIPSGFLLFLELMFNLLAYAIFNNYFFYYFVPDLGHWTSVTNLPFWWLGYRAINKYCFIMQNENKLNFVLALMFIFIAYA